MKKIIKNPIFTFILGALIFGGIVGVSAYTIFANDIGYTPKDSTWKKSNGEDITNVKDAIDDLYSKANSIHFTDSFLNGNIYDIYYGNSIKAGSGATKVDGVVSLNQYNAFEYGPDKNIPSGQYFVLINGENLNNDLVFDVTDANNSSYIVRPEKVDKYDHYAFYSINITQNLSSGEFRIWNHSQTNVTKIKYVLLFKVI